MHEIDLMAEAERRFDAETVAELRKHRRRMIHLQVARTPEQRAAALPGCWLGGLPRMPETLPWPVLRELKHDFPMTFVGQFDCAALPKLAEYPMPETGTLFFFYDFSLDYLRSQSGYDEIERGGCVYYSEQDCTALPPVPRPATDPAAIETMAFVFEDIPEEGGFGMHTYAEFVEIVNAPSLDRQDVVPVLTDEFQFSQNMMGVHQETLDLRKHRDNFVVNKFEIDDDYNCSLFGSDFSDSSYSESIDIVQLLSFSGSEFFPIVSDTIQFMIPRESLISLGFKDTFIGWLG